MKFVSHSPRETINLGRRLARLLKKGDIICLCGELGSGKTTFVKGLAEGLGVAGKAVSSPSFVLINEFKGKLTLFHFDLYRMNNLKEIFSLGLEEYLFGEGVSAIEWAQRLKGVDLGNHLKIEFKLKGPTDRTIELISQGQYYKKLIQKL